MGSEKNPSKSGDWDGIREDIESKLGYFGQQCCCQTQFQRHNLMIINNLFLADNHYHG